MLTLDKAKGMLVGLAVGDALGAPLEFTDPREPEDYITKYHKGGWHDVSIGEWTDDTAMALAMAQAFIDNDGEFNPADIMHNWSRWYNAGEFIPRGKCFDIGGTTQRAIDKYNKNNTLYNGVSLDSESGNGALMRLAPVILVSATPERAMELAVAQTIMTHGSPKCIEYSRVFAHELWHGEPLYRYKDYRLPDDVDRRDVMSGGYVVETYQCAMWALKTTKTFKDCIVAAVNRGHDSDTCGAVAGMIAGAYYGYKAIPAEFKQELDWHDELKNAATKLFMMRR
jgi:ADP-ribosyl-[dinitrogen reductase] hydrolase